MRAALIDDDPKFRRTAGKLTQAGLRCDPIDPGSGAPEARQQLISKLQDPQYTIILLDYRLDGETANMRAGGISAELRELRPDLPVVLLTSESNQKEFVDHNPVVREAFDRVIRKENIISSDDHIRIARELCDLSEGYAQLAIRTDESIGQTISQRLFELVDATNNERNILKECLGGVSLATSGEIARWLLRELLVYPGPLLDSHEASAFLGVDYDWFAHSGEDYLKAAQYGGPFSKMKRRWWRGRLSSCIAKAALAAPLKPASCSWCNEQNVTRCCSSCRKPVGQMHCLAGTIDRRPRWAMPSVFCFQCIATRDLESVHFGAAAIDIATALRQGEISPP